MEKSKRKTTIRNGGRLDRNIQVRSVVCVFEKSICLMSVAQNYSNCLVHFAGLGLPSPRDDSKFDPAAKYHIPGDIEYIRQEIS